MSGERERTGGQATDSFSFKHNSTGLLVGCFAEDGHVHLARCLVVVHAALDELAADLLDLLGADEEVLARATALEGH